MARACGFSPESGCGIDDLQQNLIILQCLMIDNPFLTPPVPLTMLRATSTEAPAKGGGALDEGERTRCLIRPTRTVRSPRAR